MVVVLVCATLLSFLLILAIVWFNKYFLDIFTNFLPNKFQYWDKKGIPCVKDKIPCCEFSRDYLTKAYRKLKNCGEFGGLYFSTRPVVLITNLCSVSDILKKNIAIFHSRGEEWSHFRGLLAQSKLEWKNSRNKLMGKFYPEKNYNIDRKTKKNLENIKRRTILVHAETLKNKITFTNLFEMEIQDILSRYSKDVLEDYTTRIQFQLPNESFSVFRIIKRIRDYFLKWIPYRNASLHMKIIEAEDAISSTMALALYELAQNQKIQNRARNSEDYINQIIKGKFKFSFPNLHSHYISNYKF